jgi:hypothetical protein
LVLKTFSYLVIFHKTGKYALDFVP